MTIVENERRMKAMLDSSSPSLESFEETYKTAYSHGLEDIYALKNVDLTKVKRIQSDIPEAPSMSQEESVQFVDHSFSEDQLEMELGDRFRGWIEPFFLREPIRVLGLSNRAELCLVEHGKQQIRDLIGHDLLEYVFLKGMGQGHIDEIQKSLSTYIGNRSLKRSYRIEFTSWVRSIVDDMDPKKIALFLRSFELESLVPLSTTESFEVRRIDPETEKEWVDEVLLALCSEERTAIVQDDMTRVVHTFIIPWMRNRMGIATKTELLERLERISDSRVWTRRVIPFFSGVYYNKQFPLVKNLYQVETDLFCCDAASAQAYRNIIEKALTYFYKPTTLYPFSNFVSLLLRDFAREWIGFHDSFVAFALRRSSQFRVRRGVSGDLEIRQS